jgi:hypothetical protein
LQLPDVGVFFQPVTWKFVGFRQPARCRRARIDSWQDP